MKKKLILGLILVCLLFGCELSQEKDVPKMADIPGEYDHIKKEKVSFTPDAIIDTEAEFDFILNVHKEYEKIKVKADQTLKKASTITTYEKNETENVLRNMNVFSEEISGFKNRVDNMTLPSDYKNDLNNIIALYLNLKDSEYSRIGELNAEFPTGDYTLDTSKKLYEKIQRENKILMESYNEIMSKK